MSRIRLSGNHSAYHAGSAAVWRRLCEVAGEALVPEGAEYDVLVMNGEGSMHHGSKSFHAKMQELRSALNAGKRAWLVNSVWQENPHDYDDVLGALEGVVVREPLSRMALQEHGVKAQVALDLSFHATPMPAQPVPLDFGGGVAITDFNVPSFNTFMRVTGGRMAVHAFLDLRAGNWDWAIASLRTARLLVTGRHHAVFAACRARVPFAALTGNTHKIEGLIKASGLKIPICREPAQLPAVIRFAERNPELYAALFDWMESQPAWSLPWRLPVRGMLGFTVTAGPGAKRGEGSASSHLVEHARALGMDPGLGRERMLLAAAEVQETSSMAVRLLIGTDQDKVVTPPVLDALNQARAGAEGAAAALLDARLAAAHLTRQSYSAARQRARAALDALRGDARRKPAALALASVFQWHGRSVDAEALLMRDRPGTEMFEALAAVAELRLICRFDDTTRALLAFLANQTHPGQPGMILKWFDYLWRLDGPSAVLLEESGGHESLMQSSLPALRAARIAMACQLGEHDQAAALLRDLPAAARFAQGRLPLARMLALDAGLRSDVAPALDPEWFAPAADIARALLEGTTAIATWLADPRLRVAVVGNAASEVGRGSGPAIDAHDIVIRFNRARVGEETAPDYGRRTTLQLVSLRQPPEEYPVLPGVEGVLFGVADAYFRNQDWRTAAAHHAQGLQLACIPGEVWRPLAARLGAPPSNGMIVLSWLRQLRGPLPRSSLFGFAFTDQLGAEGASSHYYELSRPSMHHNWAGERTLFEKLLAKP